MKKKIKISSDPNGEFDLKKRSYGALPVICHFLERMGIKKILEGSLKQDRYVDSIMGLIKSIMLSPQALYCVSEWSEKFDQKFILSGNLSDDVIGRGLEKFFHSDRSSIMSSVVLKVMKEFDVSMESVHNDSTSVKVYGQYKNQNPKAIQLKYGHSKDHRPDLRQLLYNLCVTRDGGIPIFFKVYDGNKTDDTTHIETWQSIKGILDRSNFLYVADSKLCTRENMDHIDRNQGRFITVLPRTRSEVRDFVDASLGNEVRWEECMRKKTSRDPKIFEIFYVASGEYRLSEGYRIYWYRSSEKLKRDKDYRETVIMETMNDLHSLMDENRRGPKTVKAVTKRVDAILNKKGAHKWFQVEIRTEQIEEFKKENPGPATPDSKYIKKVKRVANLRFKINQEEVDKSKLMDGIFPLVTNSNESAKEVLLHYKYQPYIEKRHMMLKSVLAVAPIHLKKNERIEALMFVYYLAQMISCLIEREARKGMQRVGIEQINILPESRPSKAPTWTQIKRSFEGQGQQDLNVNGKIIKIFKDELSPLQIQVLEVVGVQKSFYE